VHDLKKAEPGEVDSRLEKVQQAWAGVLGWACKTQPHISVVFSEVSSNNTSPCESSVCSVKRACEYAKETYRPLKFESVRQPAMVWWVDASYNIYTCDGRLGWELQIVDEAKLEHGVTVLPYSNLVQWKTKRTDTVCAATTSAELLAMMAAVKQLLAYVALCKALWGVTPRVCFATDSQPLLGWLRTGRATPDPHFQGPLDLVLERIREYGVGVVWVNTKSRRADRHKKCLATR
jgi:hypothetical protein